ncbi:DUF4296 domain-containing protein [Formosa sp. 3Alg 14/1]|uniref:DUF4296 domain-containing protein n=1 Tax=unclassified Formosa TaxID=2644710 RepID=UPI0039BE13D5
MNRLIGLFFVLVSVTACHQVNKPEPPEDLIPKDKMVNIIIDMSLLTSSRGVDRHVLEKNNISLETLIYDKYNIDSLQLVKSSEYYSYYMKEYEGIYQIVNDSLTKLKDKYTLENEKVEEVKKSIKDSVSKPVDSLKLKKERAEQMAVLDSLSTSKKKD